MEDARLYEILGVNEYSARAEIVSAYRKLAMQWHPDRNPAPGAESKFQEIQSAYRTLLARHKPRTMRDMWSEAFGDSEYLMPEDDSNSSPFWSNFPFVAAACLLVGAAFLAAAEPPGGIIVFSLAAVAAGHLYKTGETSMALRVESAFRLVLHLYFTGLLAWGVWTLGWRIIGI